MTASGRQAGFTLLEIIVALVVFGFLILALNAGTRTGFALWKAQAKRIDETEQLDATARVLRAMLTSMPLLPTSAGDAIPQAIAITGEADRLAFVGELPTGLGGQRLADITVRLNGGRLLIGWTPHRHEQATGTPPALVETELVRGVEGFELAYFAPAGPGLPALWRTKWTDAMLPWLIRMRLRFAKGDPRRWPELVVAPQLAAR